MKKVIFLMLAFLGFAAFSQTNAFTMTGSHTTSDTVTNAATEYLKLKVQNNYSAISIQYVGTKISGTVGGTVTLQVSNDGVNYVAIDTNATLKRLTDSYTNTDVTTNSFVWTVTKPAYLFYRLAIAGTGTMALKVQAFVVPKREHE